MKIDVLHMSDAEQEIMEYLWREQKPVTAADIIDGLSHRKWKPSTVHTFVMNLIDEGFIKYYKAGGRNYYVPYISDYDYNFVVTKAFVDIMHDGSIVEIVRTLLCDLELSADELLGLQELVNSAVCPREKDEETEETGRLNAQNTEKTVAMPVRLLLFHRFVDDTYDSMNEDEEKYLSSA